MSKKLVLEAAIGVAVALVVKPWVFKMLGRA